MAVTWCLVDTKYCGMYHNKTCLWQSISSSASLKQEVWPHWTKPQQIKEILSENGLSKINESNYGKCPEPGNIGDKKFDLL